MPTTIYDVFSDNLIRLPTVRPGDYCVVCPPRNFTFTKIFRVLTKEVTCHQIYSLDIDNSPKRVLELKDTGLISEVYPLVKRSKDFCLNFL